MNKLVCPNCNCELKEVDIIYNRVEYDRHTVDMKNKCLSLNYGDTIDQEFVQYECRECNSYLPKEISEILNTFTIE